MTKERFIPDLLNLQFEYLFKTIGRDTKHLPYQVRCLALVLIMYLPGLIVTSITGTGTLFISVGWGFFLSNILIGLVVWLLIGFLKKVNRKFEDVNKIIAPMELETSDASISKEQEEENDRPSWDDRKKNYNERIKGEAKKGAKWYYPQALGAAILGLLISKIVIVERIGWIQGNLFTELYFLIWFTFLGFLAGACIYYITTGFWMIRRYCKNVITQAEILPLDPDRTGGLKELGRLSIDLDLVVALPSLVFIIYLPQNPEILAGELGQKTFIALSILYTLLLIFVFFISLSPAHDDMIQAKTKYLIEIHTEYRDLHNNLIRKIRTKGEYVKPEDYDRIKGLYDLYDRAESMSVWPLDYRIMFRFLITSILPLISGLTIITI